MIGSNETQGHLWEDFASMLEDIWRYRQETGHVVEVFDDPAMRRFGYKAGTRCWQISVSNTQRSLQRHPRRPFFQEGLRTAESRLGLANLGAYPDP